MQPAVRPAAQRAYRERFVDETLEIELVLLFLDALHLCQFDLWNLDRHGLDIPPDEGIGYELDLMFECFDRVGEGGGRALERSRKGSVAGEHWVRHYGSGGASGEEPFLLACCSRATVCRSTHVKT